MRDEKKHVTTVMVPSIEYVYLRYRGGASISKVVRPLQIKITCACARGGGGQCAIAIVNAWVPMQSGRAMPGS